MTFLKYLESRSFENRLSTVLRVARKSKGLSCEALCQDLGLASKSYLCWENGKDFPNLVQWKSICDYFSIGIDSCRYGFIDHNRDVIVDSNPKVGSFFLPLTYAQTQAASNRWLSPIIEYLRFRLGAKPSKRFFQSLNIDEDYFYLYDHQINFTFIQDLFKELIKLKLNKREIRQITSTGIRNLYPDILNRMYSIYRSPDFIFLNLEYLNRRFDLNFQYELVEESNDSYFIANTSALWLKDKFRLEGDILELYHLYKREWFKHVTEFVSQRKIIINEIELDNKEDIECLFQAQVV